MCMTDASSKNNNFFDDILAENAQYWEEKQNEVNDARAKAGGSKENFEIQEFMKYYSLNDLDGVQDTSEETILRLEVEYYVDNPDIKTLEEFAQHKLHIDSQPNR